MTNGETEHGRLIYRRQRSARRLRHEAQISVFKGQAGDLEEIRLKLGLRPSQICEILKVHPSAWTRWIKQKQAPPHIYQMLDWYLELLQWRGQYSPTPSVDRSLTQQDPEIYVRNGAKNLPALASGEQLDITSSLGPKVKTDFLEILKSPGLSRMLIAMWCLQSVLWGIIITLLLRKT